MPDRARQSRRGFFTFVFMILVLLGAYTVYWFYMANQLTVGVEDWIDDQRAAGYAMEHNGLKMSGYPYRFHLDIDAPDITTPDGDWRWRGEQLVLVMQPWNWNHVIGYADGRHVVTHPEGQETEVETAGAQGSFRWDEESIQRISLITGTINAVQNGAQLFSGEGLNLHLSPFPNAPEDLRILAGFTRLSLPSAPKDAEWLGPEAGPLSAPIRITKGVSILETSGDPAAIVRAFDPSLSSPLTELTWGPLQVKLKTDGLSLDKSARPSGALNIRVENIDALKAALAENGELTDEISQGLDLVKAGLPEDTSFLPITFRDGQAQFMFQKIADLQPVF